MIAKRWTLVVAGDDALVSLITPEYLLKCLANDIRQTCGEISMVGVKDAGINSYPNVNIPVPPVVHGDELQAYEQQKASVLHDMRDAIVGAGFTPSS